MQPLPYRVSQLQRHPQAGLGGEIGRRQEQGPPACRAFWERQVRFLSPVGEMVGLPGNP